MGLIDIALAVLNRSRICHVYNVYSSINRGVNKKEGAILKYFNVYNIFNVRYVDSAITYCPQVFF